MLVRRLSLVVAAFIAAGASFTSVPARAEFLPLPISGAQVNDDPANSIDPTEDANRSDVTGGALTAGNVPVPWATFEQRLADGTQHVFVRAFKGGVWTTQGLPASLNVDPTVVAEGPSIDFAGANRTVPWVAWYEPHSSAPQWPTNIFASRFSAAANVWLPSGQSRFAGGILPSLNVHTLRTAANPSLAGGAAVAGNDPVPWVVWEENDGVPDDDTTRRQIFVSKALKQEAANLPCPTGTKPGGGVNLNGLCWQLVGLSRLNPNEPTSLASGDPTLNVDPTRSGVEPDMAFTGPSDSVAWVVWYEEGDTLLDGLRSNDMVFAARIVADANAVGGFHWRAVGNGTAGQTNVLDTSGANGFGGCAESRDAEDACSLNAQGRRNGLNPRVAAGTLAKGGTTVPWVVWQEEIAEGRHAVFVSRMVGGDHFELFNQGNPLSDPANDATRPDITFSGHVLYVTWQEQIEKRQVTFVGHFEGGAAAPVFVLDTPTGIPGSGLSDVDEALRAPVSSGCTASPFNSDGDNCPGGALGTPFFLYAAGDADAQKLFAQAYAPGELLTLPATDVSGTSITLNGTVDPGGAVVGASFDLGVNGNAPETPLGVASVATPFAETIEGFAVGDTVHFQAVARTDFVTVVGPEVTVTIENTPPAISIDDLPDVVKRKALGEDRLLTVQLSVSEGATVTLELLNRRGKVLREVTVQREAAGSFDAQISLKRARAKMTLRATATDANGASTTVEEQFKGSR